VQKDEYEGGVRRAESREVGAEEKKGRAFVLASRNGRRNRNLDRG
jgi:hypothetical protein